MKKTTLFQRLPFFYGWMVLALTFLALFASFGIRVSFGSYVTSWESEFAISRTAVTLVSLTSFFVIAVSQPLIERLNDRFGARMVLTMSMALAGAALLLCSVATSVWQLLFLYGVVVAFALTGASNITGTAVISRWFTAKRGLALGIATSGMAVGQLTVVPLSLYMINHFNWRFSTEVIGLGVLVIFLPLMAILVRSKPVDVGLQPYGEKDLPSSSEPQAKFASPAEKKTGAVNQPIWTIFRQRVFWQLSIPYFFCGFTDVGLVDTHFIPFAEGNGFPVWVISLSFSLIAVANIFGTIGTGYLADRWNRSRLLALIYALRGLTFLFLLIAGQPWLLMIFALIYGITEMASIAPTSSYCAHFFGKYSLGVIFGLVSISHQLGGAIGSLVPGIIYDSMHSYVPVFILSAVLMAVSAAIISRIPDNRAAGPLHLAEETVGSQK